MDFEQQKPITDEYRRGWERIYLQQEARKAFRMEDECHYQSRSDTSQSIQTES